MNTAPQKQLTINIKDTEITVRLVQNVVNTSVYYINIDCINQYKTGKQIHTHT